MKNATDSPASGSEILAARPALAAVRQALADGLPVVITDGTQGWRVGRCAGGDSRLLISAPRAQALGLPDSENAAGALAYVSQAPLHASVVQALLDPATIKLSEPHELSIKTELRRAVAPRFAAGLLGLMATADRLPVLFLTTTEPNDACCQIDATVLQDFAESPATPIRTADAAVPTVDAETVRMVRFADFDGSPREHLALIYGEPDLTAPVLVRVHSKCATGDLFGSRRCDCGDQLAAARSRLGAQDGVLLYLDQEGRGIGLSNKLHAYRLQDQGLDTFEANHQLGFEQDARTFDLAARILTELGIGQVRLLSNNPDKVRDLHLSGIEVVERLALIAPEDSTRDAYLAAKKRSGHFL